MKVPFYFFTIFLGIILAVRLAMNGKVGSALGNPRVGNAVFWCIGAATALLIGLTGWRSGVLNGFKDVHPLLLTAGALGACLVFAIAWLLPQVGARAMFITLIAGASPRRHDSFPLRLAGFPGATDHAPQRNWSRGHDMRRGACDLYQGRCISGRDPIH